MKAVILAAGDSSRFKPLSDKRHKGLTEVLGQPIIEHTIEGLRNARVDEVIVVQSPDRRIEEELGGSADHYVVQEEPKGMGHALEQARDHLEGNFLVLTPYRANAAQFFEPMIEKSEEEDTEVVFVSTPTDEPEKYGILEFDESGEKAVDMVEKPDADEAPSNRKIVGMYLLHENFFDHMDEVEEWEYQYEDALSRHMQEKPASVLKVEEETNSIKYPWDLFSVVEELLESRDGNISEKAVIADSAEIKGDVIVEEGAKIYENAVIRGPAYIGEGATVGNNAVLRDHVSLEENATVGANSEVKKAVFQPGSSMHSGFVGDSVIGRNSKLGAGTIVANRQFREEGERPEIKSDLVGKDYVKETGRDYLGTFIGEDVDIGVNVSLMPGVQVASGATIGPGTVVRKNVDMDETVYINQDIVRR